MTSRAFVAPVVRGGVVSRASRGVVERRQTDREGQGLGRGAFSRRRDVDGERDRRANAHGTRGYK